MSFDLLKKQDSLILLTPATISATWAVNQMILLPGQKSLITTDTNATNGLQYDDNNNNHASTSSCSLSHRTKTVLAWVPVTYRTLFFYVVISIGHHKYSVLRQQLNTDVMLVISIEFEIDVYKGDIHHVIM